MIQDWILVENVSIFLDLRHGTRKYVAPDQPRQVMYPRQSRGLVMWAAQSGWIFGPPEGGYFNRLSCSSRLSSASWLRIYSRITFSSRPTVDTKYPRAQKLCPTKFRALPCTSRAIAMALFPLIKPTTSLTECFGGISMHIWTWSVQRCPSIILHSRCRANSWNTSHKYLRNLPYKTLRLHLGIQMIWYLQSHTVWLRLEFLFMNKPPLARTEQLTKRRLVLTPA